MFTRLSPNRAIPSVEMTPLQWPMKRDLGGRVYFNIVDESWVYTGHPPPSPFAVLVNGSSLSHPEASRKGGLKQ
eukprot:6734219-Pyramimonas_sp.AAC.1